MSRRPPFDQPPSPAGALDDSRSGSHGSSRARRFGVLETLTESFGPVPRVLLRDTEAETPISRPSADESPARPDASGRYQVFGEIARGGMGAVLKGRDPDLGRELAIKVLLDRHCSDPEMVGRFVEEAQIAGQLQHPGIVPIYELGAFSDRRPYFAMRLVKGRTLASLIADRPSPDRDLARFLAIFESVAQAVAYAHSRGVIHRDLKPSNVMVGSFGEVQVMDWGLAKVLAQGGATDDASAGRRDDDTIIATARSTSDSDLSLAGSVMGTPSYMAPEQARGETHLLDERADVFALGSILAEILTGKPAFTGRDSAEIHRKAARVELAPILARLDMVGCDPDLIALTKRCLSPERDDRPRDAGEIARAIGSHRTGMEDRLRAAEISRATQAARAEEAQRTAEAAEARANAERRARSSTVALAAALLVLVVLGGGIAVRVAQQRQVQASRLGQALAEVETLRDRAIARSDDLARWASLIEGVRRADDLAREGAGGRETCVHLLALEAEARAGHETASRDGKLLRELVEIRARRKEMGVEATHSAYDRAFREAGFDFNTLDPIEAARSLKRRPADVLAEIVTYLDDWYIGDLLGAGLHENPVQEQEARINNSTVERRGAARIRHVACLIDPDEFRDRLRSLRNLGPLKDSVGKMRELAADPRAESLPAPTAVLLASFFEATGNFDDASSTLRRAVVKHPGDLWVNYRLAADFQFSTPPRLDEAIRYYTTARALRPTTAHMLAHVLNDVGRFAESKAIYLDLAARQPDELDHMVCLAMASKANGWTAEAASIADRLIPRLEASARAIPSAQAAMNLSRMQEIKGDVPGAIASLRELDKLSPGSRHMAHILAGDMLLKISRDPESAMAEYREAIRLKPGYFWGPLQLGRTLANLGRLDEAIVHLREAARLQPSGFDIHVSIGSLLMAQGKVEEATASFREAMRLEPARPFPHLQLGRDLARRKKIDEAIEVYRETARLFPRDTNCHNELAILLESAKGDFAAAAAEFREVIRIKPEEPDARSNLGLVLYKSGKKDEALAECREAVRLLPEWGNGRYKYGVILFNIGEDYAAAEVEFRAAARLKSDADSYLNLGRTLLKLKKDREAIAAFRGAVSHAPKGSPLAETVPGWISDLERGIDPEIHLPR